MINAGNELLEKHINQISNDYECVVSIDNRKHLDKLKNSGFEPLVIYDIGAGALTWTKYAKTIWPDAKFIAFEAYDQFQYLYELNEVEHYIGALSNKDNRLVKFYHNEYFFFGNSYYRDVDYQTFGQYHMDDYLKLPTQRLDTVVEKYDIPFPDLIKINTQGSERDILQGADNCLTKCERLIINMHHEEVKLGAPRSYQTMSYLLNHGWGCDAPFFSDNGVDGDYGFYNKYITYS
jgi:FkbM family methyltransferase